MSQITDYATAEEADLTAIGTTLGAVVSGISALDTIIQNLQGGGLSANDAAALATVKAQSTALVTQASAINTTPPVVVTTADSAVVVPGTTDDENSRFMQPGPVSKLSSSTSAGVAVSQ